MLKMTQKRNHRDSLEKSEGVMGRVKIKGSQWAGISSSAQGAAYRVQRAVMCDDVTDDVCQGSLLIALPST